MLMTVTDCISRLHDIDDCVATLQVIANPALAPDVRYKLDLPSKAELMIEMLLDYRDIIANTKIADCRTENMA